MGVFLAEPGQQDFGIAVGDVVAVAVGIEEKIRRLHDEDAAAADAETGCEVEPGDKVSGLPKAAALVRVEEDRELVGPLGPKRRRLGQAVVLSPQELIDCDRFEPCRCRILDVLQHPEATAIVEGHGHRLTDQRLAGDEADFEAVGNAHPLDGFLGREPAGANRRRTKTQ